jgi:hypothetical protein
VIENGKETGRFKRTSFMVLWSIIWSSNAIDGAAILLIRAGFIGDKSKII